MRTFFIADTHFGHKNIIGYCNRPFTSVEEMDEEMIRRWNAVVSPGDRVYVVGDFVWTRVADPMVYIDRLQGHIVLIPGDHDNCSGIQGAHLSIAKNIHEVRENGISVICCHYPILRWRRSHYGSWHVYGHIHNGLVDQIGKSVCVCVEKWQYTPVSFDDLQKAMSQLPDNPNLIRRKDEATPSSQQPHDRARVYGEDE